jgi:hypothetical protein
MASTYSTSLRLDLMATGDQSGTWGDTTNTNLGTLLEQAITGVLSVAQGDAELTLTALDGASDESRNAVVNLTGAMTAIRNVVVPTANKLYTIKNSTTGGFSVVVKTTSGTGVSVPPGASIDVYCDGTNVVSGADYWSGQIGGQIYLDAGATVGPVHDLFRDSTSPATNDILGQVLFNGRDSADNKQEYASIEALIVSPTSTSEVGALDIYTTTGGARTKTMSVGPNNPNTTSQFVDGYATTATAAGTTTLTVLSAKNQYFTGSTTQTVVLPVTSTLVLGQKFTIVNNSTGLVTVQSSGANTIQIMGGTGITYAPGVPGTVLTVTCISTSGTDAASWAFEYETPTTAWLAYTPTFTGLGTVTGVSIFSRRSGDTLEVMGKFTVATSTGVEARMSLGFNGVDGGITADATKVPSIRLAGYGTISAAAANQYLMYIESGVGYFTFGIQSAGSAGLAKLNGNAWLSNNTFSFTALVPITGW